MRIGWSTHNISALCRGAVEVIECGCINCSTSEASESLLSCGAISSSDSQGQKPLTYLLPFGHIVLLVKRVIYPIYKCQK